MNRNYLLQKKKWIEIIELNTILYFYIFKIWFDNRKIIVVKKGWSIHILWSIKQIKYNHFNKDKTKITVIKKTITLHNGKT